MSWPEDFGRGMLAGRRIGAELSTWVAGKAGLEKTGRTWGTGGAVADVVFRRDYVDVLGEVVCWKCRYLADGCCNAHCDLKGTSRSALDWVAWT